MTEPQIIVGGDVGFHNSHEAQARKRLREGKAYRDISTVIIVPTRGMIPARAVENWMGLMMPMNQKTVRLFVSGMEVGAAYQSAIATVMAHPDLSKWQYILTLEEDNLPPPDGLLKLYESMDTYAAVGGLYWTKGEGGQPMIYGDPKGLLNFQPQVPRVDTIQECNGLGMGFTLFRMDLFRELASPWFQTVQEWSPEGGGRGYTQDLHFFERVRKAGHRVACDTRVKVGHLDAAGTFGPAGMVW